MKIVDKATFIKMPKNTVFCKSDGVDDALMGEMCVKTGNFGKFGFHYIPVGELWPESNEDDYIDAIEKMQKNPNVEYPGVLREYRDDDTPATMKFMVFDRHEINQIIGLLQKCVRKFDKFQKKDGKVQQKA